MKKASSVQYLISVASITLILPSVAKYLTFNIFETAMYHHRLQITSDHLITLNSEADVHSAQCNLNFHKCNFNTFFLSFFTDSANKKTFFGSPY